MVPAHSCVRAPYGARYNTNVSWCEEDMINVVKPTYKLIYLDTDHEHTQNASCIRDIAMKIRRDVTCPNVLMKSQ